MNRFFKTIAVCTALASLLSACGGGDDPDPTNRDAALTVSAATDVMLNGLYSASNTSISDVQTIARIGATDACEFTFDNVRKTTDNSVSVVGRIRWIKDANELNEFSVSINGSAFAAADGINTTVDRAASVIRFNGKTAASDDATGSLTLTGFLPMQYSRPSGC